MKRGHLTTERRNANTEELDRLSVAAAIALIQDEDRAIHAALEAARPALVAATELVVERLARGGRATEDSRMAHSLRPDGAPRRRALCGRRRAVASPAAPLISARSNAILTGG